jgi:hypothetical protein
MARGDTALKVTWVTDEVDAANYRLRQRSRIEVLSGPLAGEVLEETHKMTAWTPAHWRAAVARSPFVCTATHDGDRDDRPRVQTGRDRANPVARADATLGRASLGGCDASRFNSLSGGCGGVVWKGTAGALE